MTTALDGIRIVELAHERGAYAGKLLADMGADVVVVEPPGGSELRRWGPFVDDRPDPERASPGGTTTRASVPCSISTARRAASTSPPRDARGYLLECETRVGPPR